MKRLFICTHFSRCTKIILSEGEGTARDRTNTKFKKKPRQITFYYRVNIRRLQRARLHNLFGERIQMGSSVSDSGTGGGETEDGRTWRINNDELSGTYAVTFINSLLMTYLAVVGLTCVYCVNVQTLRWGQMFGRHVCTLINSVHAQRSCVCVCLCARTQTSTPTITSTDTHTHGLSHSTSSGSRGGKSHLFPSLLVDICPVSSLNRPLAPEQTRAPSFKHHRKIFNILKWDWVGNLLDDNGRRKTGVTKRIARR